MVLNISAYINSYDMNHFAETANKKKPDGSFNDCYQGKTFISWLDDSDLRVKQYGYPLNQKKDELIRFNNELYNLVLAITRLYKQLRLYELDNTVGETGIILRRIEVLESLNNIKFYTSDVKHCVLESKFDCAISFKNYCIEKFKEIVSNIEFVLSIRVYSSPLEDVFRDVLDSFEKSIDKDELKILYEYSKTPSELPSEIIKERQDKEHSKSELHLYDKFDKIRSEETTNYDITVLIKELSNNYEIDLLESLQKEIELYLFIEKDIKECEYSSLDVDTAIKERLEKGLEIPYYKTKSEKELTAQQKEIRPRMKAKGMLPSVPSINKEQLLFPFEFYNIYSFQNAIRIKISELKQKLDSINSFASIDINETNPVTEKIFKNNFDDIHETKVYNYFKSVLVDKKLITLETLNEYLIIAFENRRIPEVKFNFIKGQSNGFIIKIFYTYYKNIVQSQYGKQDDYIRLLTDYFDGFEFQKVKNNFSR